MRGLFDSYNRQLALYQQAAVNVEAAKQAKADDILTTQLVKLQSLTPSPGIIAAAQAPTPAVKVVAASPNYSAYYVGGAAALQTSWIEAIEDVDFEELNPECLWKFRIRGFGPLLVALISDHFYSGPQGLGFALGTATAGLMLLALWSIALLLRRAQREA